MWHYLAPPRTITHPSNDYWLPLASVLMSVPMRVLGKSVFAALLPGVVAGLALSLVVYGWSRRYTSSTLVAFGAASLMLFEPQLFAASLATETLVYFALLASCGFWFMNQGLTNPRFFLLAALCAGLGHLTRPDGVFLLLALWVVIWISPHPRTTKLTYALLSSLLCLTVLSPWLILNYHTLGFPVPPGALKIMFVAEYEDRYAYAKELSLRAYLQSGLANIVWSKLEAAGWNLKTLLYLGELLWNPRGSRHSGECRAQPRAPPDPALSSGPGLSRREDSADPLCDRGA